MPRRGPIRSEPIQPEEWANLAAHLPLAPLRTRVLIMLLAETGLRRREVAKLDCGDLHLRGDTPHLLCQAKLKRGKERKVFLSPRLAGMLAALVGLSPSPDAPAFAGERGRLGPSGIWRVVTDWSARYGKAIRPHLLRHFACSVYQDLHKDLAATQRLAGHADPRTTASYYIDPWDRTAAARAKAVGEWLSSQPERAALLPPVVDGGT